MATNCTDCGRRLNRHSPGPQCGPCAWEALARMGEPPQLSPAFWAERAMRHAATTRDLQQVLRIYLDATGLTQEALALLIDSDQGTVSKIVRGQRRRFTIEDLESVRDGLHMPGHLFGLLPGSHELGVGVTVWTPPHGGDDPTKRRSFNLTILLTALGITGPLADALTTNESPPHIGMEHVNLLQTAIEELEQRDAKLGGDTLLDVASKLHERSSNWLQRSSYPPEVGEALQSVVGELGAWVGWMAFDAARHDTARRAWQETLLVARMTDDHLLEAQVLTYMCLQSLRQDRGREALQMAKTAERITDGWATPRLRALIRLRIGLGHAATGNETGLNKSLATARQWYAQGTHPDDPLFVHFVAEQEMAGITATSYVDLARADPTSSRHRRRLERASEIYQTISESPDPTWRRNTSFYNVRLADARLRLGDVAGASEIGLGVIRPVSSLNSARIRHSLHELRDRIHAATPDMPRARQFVEAYDAAFAAGRQQA